MTPLTLPGPGEASDSKAALAARLAQLPAVDRLLARPGLAELAARFGSALVKRAGQLPHQRRRLPRPGRAKDDRYTFTPYIARGEFHA